MYLPTRCRVGCLLGDPNEFSLDLSLVPPNRVYIPLHSLLQWSRAFGTLKVSLTEWRQNSMRSLKHTKCMSVASNGVASTITNVDSVVGFRGPLQNHMTWAIVLPLRMCTFSQLGSSLLSSLVSYTFTTILMRRRFFIELWDFYDYITFVIVLATPIWYYAHAFGVFWATHWVLPPFPLLVSFLSFEPIRRPILLSWRSCTPTAHPLYPSTLYIVKTTCSSLFKDSFAKASKINTIKLEMHEEEVLRNVVD